jgi:hypothetical protein
MCGSGARDSRGHLRALTIEKGTAARSRGVWTLVRANGLGSTDASPRDERRVVLIAASSALAVV